jgi:hypothetical protein
MEDESTLYIHYNFKFSMCRLLDDMLIPSTISVKAEVDIIDDALVTLAFRKIEYWLTNIVGASLAISAGNAVGFDLALDSDNVPRLRNHLMITPDEPSDDHLCLLLQSKLQALAAGAFAVGTIELSSDTAEGLVFTYVGDCEEDLPDMEGWIDGPTWFDRPWWMRDDGTVFDTLAPEDADLSEKPNWAIDLGFLANDAPREAVIIKGNFRPQIIKD